MFEASYRAWKSNSETGSLEQLLSSWNSDAIDRAVRTRSTLKGALLAATLACPLPGDVRGQAATEGTDSMRVLDQRLCYHTDEIPESVKPFYEKGWRTAKRFAREQAGIRFTESTGDCLHIRHPLVVEYVAEQTDALEEGTVESGDYLPRDRLRYQFGSSWDGLVQTGIGTVRNALDTFDEDITDAVVDSYQRNKVLYMANRPSHRTSEDIYVHPFLVMTRMPTDGDDVKERIVRNVAKRYLHEVGHNLGLMHWRKWARVTRADSNGAIGSCVNVMDPNRPAEPGLPDGSGPGRTLDERYGFTVSDVQVTIMRMTLRDLNQQGKTVRMANSELSMTNYPVEQYRDKFGQVTTEQYRCGQR